MSLAIGWRARAAALVLVLPVAAASCIAASGSTGVAALAPLVRHVVPPAETDSAIGGWRDAHHAAVDTAARRLPARLFVFLPGTNGTPARSQRIVEEAARLGYHAISLMDANDIAVLQGCVPDPDPGCMAAMRREIIEGADVSPHVQVGMHDGIDNRLLRLLQHLDARHPGEGWSAFLAAGALRSELVAVGGLSQGGGHAAFIGTRRLVARVLMFGAPADGVDAQPGPWVAIGATPSGRYFGFAHHRDPFRSIVPNWGALGLPAFGPVATVETLAPPFGGSHMLSTDLLPATGSYGDAHASVVADGATPLDADGVARFAPVWRYMLGG